MAALYMVHQSHSRGKCLAAAGTPLLTRAAVVAACSWVCRLCMGDQLLHRFKPLAAEGARLRRRGALLLCLHSCWCRPKPCKLDSDPAETCCIMGLTASSLRTGSCAGIEMQQVQVRTNQHLW